MAITGARGHRRGRWWVLAVLVTAAAVLLPGAPVRAAVPAPGPNQTVISVRVGSDTLPVTGVSPVQGVVLGLADTSGALLPDPWARCTSDADGDCSFTVPGTAPGEANNGRRFLVQGVSAPPGYRLNPRLTVGALAGPWNSTPYQFLTAPAAAGQTQLSGRDFMTVNGATGSGGQYQASTGVFQVSRADEPDPGKCGLRVALILDFSASVTAADFAALKQVSVGFVNALERTPSSIAVYSFATTSTEQIPLTPVATPDQANAVNTRINALTRAAGGFTNWDSAFSRVAFTHDDYDIAVMITDGNPTLSDVDQGTAGASVRFSALERGVFSANAVKAQGTRVIAFGIGAGVAGSAENLAAISGPVEGSDYYLLGGYGDAAADLRRLAQGDCRPSVTVIKEVLPPGATSTAGGEPAGGWQFTTTATNATVSGSPGTTAFDGTGAVNFPLGFANPSDTATVQVVETQQPGYTPFPANAAGANAACYDLDTGDPVAVTNNASGPGFQLPVTGDQGVSCTVYNVAPDPLATLEIAKEWVVNGTTYPQGDQPEGLSADLSLDGERADFATVTGPWLVGSTVSVDENVTIELPLCTSAGSSLTIDGTTYPDLPGRAPLVTEGPHTGVLTNTVDCTSRLTLAKQVEGGPADPTSWNLTGTGGAGDAPGPDGPSGSPGATATVTPDSRYALAESGGDPRYAQLDNRDPDAAVPGSTGSWHCEWLTAGGEPYATAEEHGVNGGATVPLGEWQRCVATNQTATLTLSKAVDNTGGGTRSPADWRLTATPRRPAAAGLEPESVTGSAGGASITIRPDQPYTITEHGPSGYHATLRCDTGPNGATIATDQVTAVPLAHPHCRFTNTFAAPGTGAGLPATGFPLLPVLLSGAGLVLLGTALRLGARR